MLKDILALNDKLNNKSPLVIAFLASLLFAFIVYGVKYFKNTTLNNSLFSQSAYYYL